MMNRFCRWGFAVLVMLTVGAGSAFAGSCGNPVLNPMAREFTLSLEMGYLNRDMEFEGENDDLSSYSMALKGTYGITSRLAVFGRLGMSDLRLDNLGFSGALEPSYGAGLTVALFRAKSDPSVNIVLSGGYDRLQSSEAGTELGANCYSGSLIATKGIKDLLLYGGFRFSAVDLSGDRKVPGMDSDDPFGFVAGVDYGISERIYLMAEAHLIDQYAATLGIGFNFGR